LYTFNTRTFAATYLSSEYLDIAVVADFAFLIITSDQKKINTD